MPQTPAERHLIQTLAKVLDAASPSPAPRILNIGAGKSSLIEQELAASGCRFVADRADVDNCAATFPSAGECFRCSVEDMTPVKSGHYVAAFANYVLEHVADLDRGVREIHRVLAPDGVFVASLPNPLAPEFVVSRLTPLWVHRMVRGAHAWETEYDYRSIPDLLDVFQRHGFQVQEVTYWPFLAQYLHRHAALTWAGRTYDRIIAALRARRWMGNVCVSFRKPGRV
jgi:SAM-dependent methyltransferase